MGQNESKGKETRVDTSERTGDHDQTLEITKQINRNLTEQYRRIEVDRNRLQQEKDEAERRLGKLMSAKLYDNNPAIADLSDPYRPTKLAEQFSGLYDNEWTDAYDVLQNLNCSHQHIVRILLELVMEFYLYVCELYKSEVMMNKLVNSTPFKNYIDECIRLCLMMHATDPPVLIEIPGWKSFKERSGKVGPSTESEHNYSADMQGDGSSRFHEHVNTEHGQITCNEQTIGSNDDEQTRTNQTESMTCVEKQTHTHTSDDAFEGGQNKIEHIGAAHVESMETNIVKSNNGGIACDGQESKGINVDLLESSTEDVAGYRRDSTEIKVAQDESNSGGIVNGGQEIIKTKVNQEDTNTRDITGDRQYSTWTKVDYIEIAATNISIETTKVVETMTGSNSNVSTSLLNKSQKEGNSLTESSVKERNDGKPFLEAKSDRHDIRMVDASDTDECFEAREHNVDIDVDIRPEFDTNTFREYTHRGKYVDYYVWPVVYLHPNGPVLSRSIAQGTNDLRHHL